MLQAVSQRLGNLGAYSEIEIGNPKRSEIMTSKHLVEAVDFLRQSALAIYHIIEIILCHMASVRLDSTKNSQSASNGEHFNKNLSISPPRIFDNSL